MTTHPPQPGVTLSSEDVPSTMRAIAQDRYGRPDVLELRTMPTPRCDDDRVLIRVVAASLNIYDWHMTTGTPYLARTLAGFTKPKRAVPGADVAGVVVHVGQNVTGFRVGDRVFGDVGFGALAEYASVNPKAITQMPAGIGFEQAAAVPLAGLTALQGLRDVGGLQSGRRVIVNGASGGVGTLAVQIAKTLGAVVTAVCSTAKVEGAYAIGADKVIDYTKDDYTQSERGYDLLFDNAGNRPWRQTSRVLADGGMVVTVTGPKHMMFGPLRHMLVRKLASRFDSKAFTWFTAAVKRDDLDQLAAWLESGEVVPVIERTYPLDRVPEALRYLGEGHAHGKLVIVV